MKNEQKTVKIFTIERQHEMLIPYISKTFEEHKIPLQVRSNFDTAYDGIFVGQKGLAGLYVFEQDEQNARALLNDILNSQLEE